MPTKFTNEIIAAAIEGFQAQKQRLDAQIAELRQLLTGGSGEPAAAPEPMRKRRKISATVKKRNVRRSARDGPQRRRIWRSGRDCEAPAISQSGNQSAAGRRSHRRGGSAGGRFGQRLPKRRNSDSEPAGRLPVGSVQDPRAHGVHFLYSRGLPQPAPRSLSAPRQWRKQTTVTLEPFGPVIARRTLPPAFGQW